MRDCVLPPALFSNFPHTQASASPGKTAGGHFFGHLSTSPCMHAAVCHFVPSIRVKTSCHGDCDSVPSSTRCLRQLPQRGGLQADYREGSPQVPETSPATGCASKKQLKQKGGLIAIAVRELVLKQVDERARNHSDNAKRYKLGGTTYEYLLAYMKDLGIPNDVARRVHVMSQETNFNAWWDPEQRDTLWGQVLGTRARHDVNEVRPVDAPYSAIRYAIECFLPRDIRTWPPNLLKFYTVVPRSVNH